MNKRYTAEQKEALINQYLSGTAISVILSESSIPRSTFYNWLKAHREHEKEQKPISLREYQMLERKVERLETIIKIMRESHCHPDAPLSEKLPILEQLHEQYSVHLICEALEVPRGTFYNYIFRGKHGHTWYELRRGKLREKIQTIYDESHQIYGAQKIAAVLKSRGDKVSVKVIRDLMRDMGLFSIRQESKDWYDKEKRSFKNHLNQHFQADRPNQIWVSDVTYFLWQKNQYYICVIIDLFARRVVGYKIGRKNSTQLVRSTFQLAHETRKPNPGLIFHTDRGTNYKSKTFRECLAAHEVKQSFSRAHIPYDNSVMESFFASMKKEELYRTKYRSEKDFRAAVDNYIQFYNTQRPHAKLQYKTPDQTEQHYFNTHTD